MQHHSLARVAASIAAGFATLALSATTDKLASLVAGGADPASHATRAAANVAGYHVAFLVGAGLFAISLVIALTVISARRDDLPTESAVAA